MLVLVAFVASGIEYRSNTSYRTYIQNSHSIEVFQVLDLPLTVHEASFVKSDRA